jgi:hypothetical protein
MFPLAEMVPAAANGSSPKALCSWSAPKRKNASLAAEAGHKGCPLIGMRAARPIGSVRTGSVSGRPAPLPRSRSPNVAQGGTRSTAVVPATGR